MSTPEARRRAQERFHERHPGYRAEAMKRYRARNPEKAAEHTRRYASTQEAKAMKAERNRRWRERNPERVRELSRDYQRRRSAAVVGNLAELEAWMRVVEGDPCSYCGAVGGEIEHVVPLSRGGSHSVDNLAGACKSCNSSKHARPLLAFLFSRFSHQLDVEHAVAKQGAIA